MHSRNTARRPLAVLAFAVSAALAVLVAAACDNITGPSGDERELGRRQRQWEQLALSNYDFVMRLQCFCVLGGVPIRVEVRDGTVQAQVVVETGVVVVPGQGPARQTVDDLFVVLQSAFDQDAYRIAATYDPSRGYPRTAFIDYSRNAADEEYGWEIVSLTPR